LWLGGIGLISIYFISNPTLLIVPMIGVGIAWASILSIPYALLSTSIPQHKMGYYMGIFNFFIVIPQMVAASILGYMVQHWFEGQSIFALVMGGISMMFAGFLNVFIGEKARVTAPSDL
jgi:maltose/moltooligosaccharide transporter